MANASTIAALNFTDVQLTTGQSTIHSVILDNSSVGTLFLNFVDDLIANVTPGTTPPTYSVPIGIGIEPTPLDLEFENGAAIWLSTVVDGSGDPAASFEAHFSLD